MTGIDAQQLPRPNRRKRAIRASPTLATQHQVDAFETAHNQLETEERRHQFTLLVSTKLRMHVGLVTDQFIDRAIAAVLAHPDMRRPT